MSAEKEPPSAPPPADAPAAAELASSEAPPPDAPVAAEPLEPSAQDAPPQIENAAEEGALPPPSAADLPPPSIGADLAGSLNPSLLGPCLWTFGALLWAYVVMGEWVLEAKLPEFLGAFVVLSTFGLAWAGSIGQARLSGAPRWRLVAPGVAAVLSFLLMLVLVTLLFASSRRSTVGVTTVCLWLVAAVTYAAGRVLTGRQGTKRRAWRLAGTILLWIFSGLATLVALVAVVTRS